MLGHRLDEPRPRGIVAKRAPKRLDALRQRFVGDGHARPDFIEETVLGDQGPRFADQQDQSVEIAGTELDRLAIAPQPAVPRVQAEPVEAIGGVRAFQETLSLCSCLSRLPAPRLKPQSRLKGKTVTAIMNRHLPWRTLGWGGAIALLAIPFVAMRFTTEVDWSPADFIVMGVMLAIVGGLIELAVRASPNSSYRGAAALAVLGGFLLTWANLAVGIVGSEDNPANQLFFVALLMGIAGSFVARGKSDGMARAMLVTAIAIVAAFAIAQSGIRDEPMVKPFVEGIGTSIFVLLFLGSAALFRRAARQLST